MTQSVGMTQSVTDTSVHKYRLNRHSIGVGDIDDIGDKNIEIEIDQ